MGVGGGWGVEHVRERVGGGGGIKKNRLAVSTGNWGGGGDGEAMGRGSRDQLDTAL